MTDLSADPARWSAAPPSTARPRLPARLRSRRPLVVPPAVGGRFGAGDP